MTHEDPQPEREETTDLGHRGTTEEAAYGHEAEQDGPSAEPSPAPEDDTIHDA